MDHFASAKYLASNFMSTLWILRFTCNAMWHSAPTETVVIWPPLVMWPKACISMMWWHLWRRPSLLEVSRIAAFVNLQLVIFSSLIITSTAILLLFMSLHFSISWRNVCQKKLPYTVIWGHHLWSWWCNVKTCDIHYVECPQQTFELVKAGSTG